MCGCNQPKPCGCVVKPKGCKEKDISTDCVLYTGENLVCSGIQKNTILTDVIKKLDEFICNKFNDFSGFVTLRNIGEGSEIYADDDNQGRKLIRSLRSTNEFLQIEVEGDEILFHATQTVSANLNSTTSIATFTRNNGTNYTLDLSALKVVPVNTFTTSSALNPTTGIATFNRNDGGTYTLDLTSLQQVQANFLETNSASKAFIVNKNPTKTINNTSQYTVQASDNNYVIEVNNGTNNITIIIPPTGLPTDNFFVGFIQKGTGTVTFSGYDIVPTEYTSTIYGQGHNAAIEIINGTKYVFGNLIQV